MKKNIYSLIFICFLGLGAYFGWATSSKPDRITIADGNIKFGRGPNCTGRGLCATSGISNGIPAQFHLNEEGQLQMSIAKADISVKSMQEQFVNGKFELGEDLFLTQALHAENSADIQAGPLLKAGSYTVIEEKEVFIILF